MSLCAAQDLSLAFGPKVILDGASFALGAHDRVGLVGANGTGKSTLLRLLAGLTQPDAGSLAFMRGVRAAYLPQDVLELPPGTLVESVLAAVPDRRRLEDRLAAVEQALERAADEEEHLDLAEQLADVHEELASFEERHGRRRAERILDGLGFAKGDLARPTAELSGGWKIRAALAGLLLMEPDLLLLDEPTNHLDIPSLVWFDDFLSRSRKAMVLVSHDRDFLNRQIDRVLSFEPEGLRGYTGSYDDYVAQRAAEEEELAARARRQAVQRAEVEAFIARFRAKATKARQVQSRIRMLERQELVRAHDRRATVHFRFPEVERSGREVVRLEGLVKRFGDKVVYEGLDQTVLRGERIAVVGVNGAGKSTLLKLVAGELLPDAGEVRLGHNVRAAYYAQHHTDLLDRSRSVLEEVWSLVPQMPQAQVRGILGAFLFKGDDVDKRIGVLSGGERARVALSRLLVKPSNLMLMDEPTNHLDLDSTEKLIAALDGYGGTLVFVSHNRRFINRLATRVWDVKGGRIEDWPGDLDDYLYHLAQQGGGEASAAGGERPAPARQSDRERRRREAEARQALSAAVGPVKREVAELEERIARLEEEQRQIEPQLADPAIYADFARARPLTEAFRANRDELDELYARWEEAQARLERATREVQGPAAGD